MRCAVFEGFNGGLGECSALGGADNFCSVMPPGPGSPLDDSICSAFGTGNSGDSQAECSALAQAGGYQVCSAIQALQTNTLNNLCSAYNIPGVPEAGVLCSALRPGARKAACSTFTRGLDKYCSAFRDFSACSAFVDPTQGIATGKCTALRQAHISTCSTVPGPTRFCSVLNDPTLGNPDGTCGFH